MTNWSLSCSHLKLLTSLSMCESVAESEDCCCFRDLGRIAFASPTLLDTAVALAAVGLAIGDSVGNR
jgi:hypothetical protein